MQKRPYIVNLAALTVATIALGIALYLAAGSRWFSFYGYATVALVALNFLGAIIMRRYREIGLNRWPVVAVLLPAVLAALVQIGFWVAFFEGGPATTPLAAGRALVQPFLDSALVIGGIIVSVLIVWLVFRGAVKRAD